MKTEPATKVRVRLIVLGFSCPAHEITSILGVEPTNSWTAGDPVLAIAKNIHHENGWALESPASVEDTTPEDAIQALFRSLPSAEAFERLPKDADVQLTISVKGYTERPAVFLSTESIIALAKLRASLDIDPYDLTQG